MKKKRQNSKCRRCGDRDETINNIISECSKKKKKKKTEVCEEGDPLGTVQEVLI